MATKQFSLDKVDLSSSVKINVKSGNPYRNPLSGKFGFELPGVQTIAGGRYISDIQTDAKTALANRVKYTGANQIALKKNATGKITVVLANSGRILDSFTVPDSSEAEGEAVERTEPVPNEGEAYEAPFDPSDEVLRDAILSAARDFNLNDDQIVQLIEQRIGRELSDAEKFKIQEEIDRQRMEDLIQYLDYNLYKKIEQEEPGGRVKIRTPRGYLRRTFAGFDKTQAQKVMTRLRAMGWSNEVLEEQVVKGLPKRLKKDLGYITDEEE
jgi:hypothetical protein